MAGPSLKIKECNIVDRDAIWINHCTNELKSSKIWTDKWGFLLEDYYKLEKKSRALDAPDNSSEGNEVTQKAEKSPSELSQADGGCKLESEVPPTRIPRTTTGMSSWLLVSGKSPLIKVAKEPRMGKHDILNQLGWPIDGVN